MIPNLQRQLILGVTFILIPLLGGFGSNSTRADTTENEGHNLSPYFFIEGGDSGTEKIPLKENLADVELNGYIARVELTQVYRNAGNEPINATYIFPGSTRAAVNGMTMTIGDRKITAKIKEKEEAKQVFNAAKKAGKSASLLSQKRPNVFSMDVANIMPGDEIIVEITYTEILSAEDGIYEFVLPGVVGPRYGGDANFSSQETLWVENPYLAEGGYDPVLYDIDIHIASPLPLSGLESPTHSLTMNWEDKSSVRLGLKDKKDAGNRDFILHYRLQGDKILTGLSRFEFKNENYFLLVSEPPKKIIPDDMPAREYFFVIDVSGSMHGFPLDTTKALMVKLLRDLKPSDRFNILFFSGGSRLLSPTPLTATEGNIALAESMMNNQLGGGGTELYSALQKAFAMQDDENSSRNIVVVTDGYISAEDRVFQLIDSELYRNNLFSFGIGSSVNRHLIEGIAKVGKAEAFIITNPKEARLHADRFRSYISAPALTNIQVKGNGVELYDMEPSRVPDMLAQRPLMIIGKYKNAEADASITLSGVTGMGEQQWVFPLNKAEAGDSTLPQLWARKKLERLYLLPADDKDALRNEIVELGLNYSLLTRHTSFVAVDEVVRNKTGNTKDVKQPLPLPKGVSNKAIGRPMPEPEWLTTFVLIVLLRLLAQRRRKINVSVA
ncbi:MAG: VWA domain-containing protein [Pseudomonadales bacterium]|nr:VWA domain-containing protein [Pseudomonadales bacterium]